MNLEKIFEIFGKKIFYTIAIFYWAVFFFGEKLGFELEKIPSDLYKYLVIGAGLLGSAFVLADIVVALGVFIKKYLEYFYTEKEKREYYLKAIKTIQRYENGLGILFSLLDFQPRGDHWKKHVPSKYQKPEMEALLNTFSNVAVNRSGSKKVLFAFKSDSLSYYSNQFDFDKGFFEFLEEEYFVENKHEKFDLTSNFMRSKNDN